MAERSSAAFQVLDPTLEEEHREAVMAQRWETLEGKRLGLLINGKNNSDKLLEEMAALLGQSCRLGAVRAWRKPSAYRVAPKALLDEIAEQCDAVLTGVGD
jgi:hypothetical protein